MEDKINVCYDMETGDPDDVMSLLILLAHPRVRLRAVTVYPGGKDQLGFVRRLIASVQSSLPEAERHAIKIGGFRDWSETPQIKQYLSKGITKLFPSLGDHFDDPGDAPGHDVLAQVLTEFGPANTLLITGAPLSNIKALLDYHPEIHIARLVCQGGFAGDNVVPPEKRLSKFAGLNAMASWNMGGDIAAAQQVLSSPLVASRIFVSKNVCHGVTYTEKLHSALGQAASKHPAYDLLFKTMCSYKIKHPNKAVHDPLAVCVALNNQIVDLLEVEIYYEKKGNCWGSRPAPGSSSTQISVGMKDWALFIDTFCGNS